MLNVHLKMTFSWGFGNRLATAHAKPLLCLWFEFSKGPFCIHHSLSITVFLSAIYFQIKAQMYFKSISTHLLDFVSATSPYNLPPSIFYHLCFLNFSFCLFYYFFYFIVCHHNFESHQPQVPKCSFIH